MTYGNKVLVVLTLLSFLFLTGCSNNTRAFHYDLYDNYSIKNIDGKIKLYKDDNIVEINKLNYKIKEFAFNSDVVCLRLENNEYYMIYYYNASVYGPYTKETLMETIENDPTMELETEFQNIMKAEVIYDE